MLSYWFTKITSGAGDEIALIGNGVTCIVGANNAGKSQLLRDMEAMARGDSPARAVVLSNAEALLTYDAEEELRAFLVDHADRMPDQFEPVQYRLLPSQNQISEEQFAHTLARVSRGEGVLGHLSEALVRRIAAGALGGYAVGEVRTEWSPQHSNWPLRQLYSNGDLQQELSELVRRLFSAQVFLDHVNLPQQMRVGDPGVPAPAMDKPSTAYARAVAELPTLEDQGDGLRSFVGLVLVMLVLSPRVLLLDEPESFLHPAQARVVGRWLAEEAKRRGVQVIVATHDKDFLIGLLDGVPNGSVRVVRVSRSALGGRLQGLTAEQLARYWEDPVLRYSNVLQGLFHQQVVVCESETDCRFYSAAADALAAELDMRPVTDDALFISSGGKNGAAKLLGVLANLGVEANVIMDFDALNNPRTLSAVLQDLNVPWEGAAGAAYDEAIKHVPKSDEAAKEFWAKVRNAGLSAVARGEAYRAFKALLDTLAEHRVHIVPIGEIEDFYKDMGKSAEWLPEALAHDAHKSTDVRKLIRQVFPTLVAPTVP